MDDEALDDVHGGQARRARQGVEVPIPPLEEDPFTCLLQQDHARRHGLPTPRTAECLRARMVPAPGEQPPPLPFRGMRGSDAR